MGHGTARSACVSRCGSRSPPRSSGPTRRSRSGRARGWARSRPAGSTSCRASSSTPVNGSTCAMPTSQRRSCRPRRARPSGTGTAACGCWCRTATGCSSCPAPNGSPRVPTTRAAPPSSCGSPTAPACSSSRPDPSGPSGQRSAVSGRGCAGAGGPVARYLAGSCRSPGPSAPGGHRPRRPRETPGHACHARPWHGARGASTTTSPPRSSKSKPSGRPAHAPGGYAARATGVARVSRRPRLGG